MQSATTRAPVPIEEADDALMTRHGIARVPTDRFPVDNDRYTHFADALAQARRSRRQDA